MAAILVSPTDIVHRSSLQRRGRPSKPELEKRRKQQESYKWRDARRVYLARSFDRWKRLRGRLKMKDSSLAWHLMEAHDSYCTVCGSDDDNSSVQRSDRDRGAGPSLLAGSVETFKSALVASLRQLCRKHFCFSVSLEVMGLICLEMDKSRKENFSIAETVRPAPGTSNSVHARDHINGLPPFTSACDEGATERERVESNMEVGSCTEGCSSDCEVCEVDHSPHAKRQRLIGLIARKCGAECHTGLVKNPVRERTPVDSSLRSVGELASEGVCKSAACAQPAPGSPVLQASSPVVISEDEASLPDSLNQRVPSDTEKSSGCQSRELEPIPLREVSNRIFPMEIASRDDTAKPESISDDGPQPPTPHTDSLSSSHSSVLSSSGGITSSAQAEMTASTSLTTVCSVSSASAMSVSSVSSSSGSATTAAFSSASTAADQPSIVEPSLQLSAVLVESDVHVRQGVQSPETERGGSRPASPPEKLDTEMKNAEVSHVGIEGASSDFQEVNDSSQVECVGVSSAAGESQHESSSKVKSMIPDGSCEMEEDMNADCGDAIVSTEFVDAPDQRQVTVTDRPSQTSNKEPHDQVSPSSSQSNTSSSRSKDDEASCKNKAANTSATCDAEHNPASDSDHPCQSQDSSMEEKKTDTASTAASHSTGSCEDVSGKETESSQAEPDLMPVNFGDVLEHGKEDTVKEEEEDSIVEALRSESPSVLDLSSRSNSVPQPQPPSPPLSLKVEDAQEEAMDFSLRNSAGSPLADCRPRSAPTNPQHVSAQEGIGIPKTSAASGSARPDTSQLWREEASSPCPQELDLSIVKIEPPSGDDGDCVRTTPASRPSPSPRASFTSGQSDEDSSNTNALDLLGRCVNNSIMAVSGTHSRKRKTAELDPSGIGSMCHRRELVYRVEHEFLELNPYLDFSEFSRKFEHVQQRTFYRWKKRIKDEYMFLEKNMNLSYADFCKYFPQTKEHVFSEWKKLIKAGCRFGAVSSAELSSLSGGTSHSTMTEVVSEQSKLFHLLQVNPHLTFEKFSRTHPDVPKEVFVYWQKHIHHHMAILEANPGMTYAEFQQTAPMISRDIYKHWRYILTSPEALVTQQLSRHEAGISLGGGTSQQEKRASETIQSFGSWPHSSKDSSSSLPQGALSHRDVTYSSLAEFTRPSSFSISGKDHGLDKAASSLGLYETASNLTMPYPGDANLRFPSLQAISRQAEASASIARLAQLSPDSFRRGQSDARSASQSASRSAASSQSERAQHLSGLMSGSVAALRTSPLMTSSAQNYKDGEDQVTAQLDFFSKSRKQNKAEYYHYLQHPDLDFGELTALFPLVSLRTFYRWKKEIRSAFLFLGENPDADYDIFKIQFPEIPLEIFRLWREKFSHLKKTLDDSVVPCLPPPPPPPPQTQPSLLAPPAPPPPPPPPAQRRSPINLEAPSRPDDINVIGDFYSQGLSRKQNKGEFQVLQLNPSIDFAEFNALYPHISTRTFYRWRKEIKEGMTILREEGDISFLEFQKLYPDITEEVFAVWQDLLKNEREREMHDALSATRVNRLMQDYLMAQLKANTWGQDSSLGQGHMHSLDAKATSPHSLLSDDKEEALNLSDKSRSRLPVNNNHLGNLSMDLDNEPSMALNHLRFRKQTKPEYVFLQLNPMVEFSVFNASYPDTGMRTYYRWKKEINEALDVLRNRPDITYAELTSFYPELSMDVFQRWQKMVMAHPTGASGASPPEVPELPQASAPGSLPMTSKEEEIYASSGKKHNKAEYFFVCRNPNIDFLEFSKTFNTVSQRTFYRWKKEIRESLLLDGEGESLMATADQGVMDLTPSSSFSMSTIPSSSSMGSLQLGQMGPMSSPAVKVDPDS